MDLEVLDYRRIMKTFLILFTLFFFMSCSSNRTTKAESPIFNKESIGNK